MIAKIQYKQLGQEQEFNISNSVLLPILTDIAEIAAENRWFLKDSTVYGIPVVTRIAAFKNGGYKPLAEVQGVLVKGINGGSYVVPKENIRL